ncbi:DUF1109 domain-containing protein [Pararhodobacter zhoushanensis]|uniref:DUF1109 domain-containing protein n=1 Tax=Pararhodobacter zhoushanensis TaxID=2479545 RepID=A0ABT3GX79_9RHOB|nr:DUF1109 domain-containing protein [Pararhodobacter zhoushanensis]MCW1404195.1 DUF1109 domain-containing protein [Novosphingobium sp. MW5]MCW1932164.1 DUF1109 domain-containing protein [Pararhodobacter zhoushanensis]
MKTEELIAALAADTTPGPAPARRMARALPPALLVSGLALVTLWHTRPDLAQVLASPTVYKTLVPAVLALAALWLAQGLSRPDARVTAQRALMGVLLAGLAALLVYALATTPMAEVAEILDTRDFSNCLISVPVLAALPLAGALWALRAGAPRSPGWAGAAAGLVAGGSAAAIYSLHCPHDPLMYFFPAYGSAMAIVTAAGAVIGRRLLRW